MAWNIRTLLNKMEDKDKPYLGPNIKWLKIWGLLLPKDKPKIKAFYAIIDLLMIIFILTEFIDIWLVRFEMLYLLQNIKYSMMSTINLSKVFTFLIRQDDLKSIFKYISEEDLKRRKIKDEKCRDIIRKYTKYSRTVTYSYLVVTYATVAMVIFQPVFQYLLLSEGESNIQIVNSWLPIDKNTLLGYLLRILYQIYATFYSGGWMSSFDTSAIAVIVFFKGELELLRRESQTLFGTEDEPTTKTQAKINLREFHRRHNELIKYSRLFDSCLSPIMLLYVIICAVMLCATAYQITFETSALQRFVTAEYLTFGILQLFLFCWHSNEVLYVSKDLTLGPYESIWWTRDVSEQNDIIILTDQFNKNIVFGAGPFTDINVATFISILKGAYSYYTLLSQSLED